MAEDEQPQDEPVEAPESPQEAPEAPDATEASSPPAEAVAAAVAASPRVEVETRHTESGPEINIVVNGDSDEKKGAGWKWVLQHVIVPLATTLIGAASAGYVVKVQADTELQKEKVKSAVKTAASDAALNELRKRLTPLVDARHNPAMPTWTDPIPSPLDLDEEPPGEVTDYIDPSQMQQIQGDPVLLGEANATFREEWRRVAGELKGGHRLNPDAINAHRRDGEVAAPAD